MSKDARLTLRITDELDAWLGAEAAKRGLDKAAFARMALFQRMNGAAAISAPVTMPEQARAAPIARDVIDVSAPASAAVAVQAEEVAEPVDVDSLVDGALDAAEAAGLTAPVETDEQPSEAIGGVRPLFRRPTPFTTALPSFMDGR